MSRKRKGKRTRTRTRTRTVVQYKYRTRSAPRRRRAGRRRGRGKWTARGLLGQVQRHGKTALLIAAGSLAARGLAGYIREAAGSDVPPAGQVLAGAIGPGAILGLIGKAALAGPVLVGGMVAAIEDLVRPALAEQVQEFSPGAAKVMLAGMSLEEMVGPSVGPPMVVPVNRQLGAPAYADLEGPPYSELGDEFFLEG